MKKYRYVEFTDGLWRSTFKTGKLFIVAEKEELNEYIEEFSYVNLRGSFAELLASITDIL